MFMKKLLATVASIALTGGALLGVSAPAFAEVSATDAVDITSVTETPTGAPELESPPESPTAEEPVSVTTQSLAARQSQPEKQSQTNTEANKVDEGEGGGSGGSGGDKVWVCKIVSSDHSPGGFRLGGGNQPIHVSESTLGEDVNNTGTFSDKQPSFVVPEDDASLCSREEVTVDEEVVCPANDSDGIVNITTTTTLYFGSTVADSSKKETSRELTDAELKACTPPPGMVYVCQFEASTSHPSGWVLRSGPQPALMSTDGLGDEVLNNYDFDKANPSFIVASADSSLCASQSRDVNKVVMCPTLQSNGYATVTTTKTFFYGSVQVNQKITEKIRDLTDKESAKCPPIEEPLVATAAIDFLDPSCEAPQQLVLGDIENATWGEITDPEGADDYSVTATAAEGALFDGEITEMTFTGTLDAQLDPFSKECDLVTLGLVMPAVSFSQTSCNVAGSYRLGVARGYDPALVTFTVNDVAGIVAGTYTVAGPGSVEVTVQVVEPNGIEFGWVDPPAFAFVVPEGAACDPDLPTLALGLPTLAFTGGGGVGPIWWLVPSGMILLGAAAVYVRRRMDAVS